MWLVAILSNSEATEEEMRGISQWKAFLEDRSIQKLASFI